MELPATLPDGLYFLDCSNNRLTKLPATLPTGLRYFRCGDNLLTRMPLHVLTKLTHFNLHVGTCEDNDIKRVKMTSFLQRVGRELAWMRRRHLVSSWAAAGGDTMGSE